jgi:hypothetical protein
MVDDRTRFEMYYPPFKGAVEAGVGSAMCSYNKINGILAPAHACTSLPPADFTCSTPRYGRRRFEQLDAAGISSAPRGHSRVRFWMQACGRARIHARWAT